MWEVWNEKQIGTIDTHNRLYPNCQLLFNYYLFAIIDVDTF